MPTTGPDALRAVLAIGACLVAACEPSRVHVTAPRGAEAFARFAVIGGAFAMGVQSEGLVAASQSLSWPALIAADAQVEFRQPMFRSPGCAPPLAAPLMLGRRVSGTSTDVRDSSCAGTSPAATPPADNLAIEGATAWDALHLTPKMIAATPTAHEAIKRLRYPAVLATTQSQVTAMLVKTPTFVAVELGLAEVMRAATSGLVIAATAYDAPANWTLVPAPVFTATFDAIADSVAKSGAKVAIIGVPTITQLPAFRQGAAVWSARAELATFGVAVHAGCAASANLLHAAVIVPTLVQRAIASGVAQTLSCADTPAVADHILTPGDVAQINATVAQVNAHLRQVAVARGWAFASVDDAFVVFATGAGEYRAGAQLTCAVPYGVHLSLDGLHPSAAGQRRIADAVAAAINATYGTALPIAGEPLALTAAPCP